MQTGRRSLAGKTEAQCPWPVRDDVRGPVLRKRAAQSGVIAGAELDPAGERYFLSDLRMILPVEASTSTQITRPPFMNFRR